MSRFAGIKALHALREALIGNGREDGPNAAAEKEKEGFCRAVQLIRAKARSLCSILLPRPGPSTSICKTKMQKESRRALRLGSAHRTPRGACSLCRVALSAALSAAASAYYSSRKKGGRGEGGGKKTKIFHQKTTLQNQKIHIFCE